MTEVAVLLCAGEGARLRPHTQNRPKPLVDIGGETILQRAVRVLAAAGVRELVVATGYREDAVRAALVSCPLRVVFRHNPAFDRTQNAVSLHLCASAVAGRPFFKLDGDVVFADEMLARLEAEPAPLAVAVEKRADLGQEEMKVVIDGGVIRAFGKRLDPGRSTGESVGVERVGAGAGQALFDALSAAMRAGRTALYYEDIYGELVHRGLAARAVDVSDLAWIEIDTPADLMRARHWIACGRFAARASTRP